LAKAVSRAVNQPVTVNVWSRTRLIVSPQGHAALKEIIRKQLEKQHQGPGDPQEGKPGRTLGKKAYGRQGSRPIPGGLS
jgi:hypothetical protein